VHEHLRQDADTQGARDVAGLATVLSYEAVLNRADEELHASLDRRHGGWGDAPKFPCPSFWSISWPADHSSQPQLELDIEVTLDAMAAGGMYDIGRRLSPLLTDAYWLIPTSRRCCTTTLNWPLLRARVASPGRSRYRTVATETLDYLLRELRHPQGGFFSAHDADTAEGEGAYFTWTLDEVREALDPEEAVLIEGRTA